MNKLLYISAIVSNLLLLVYAVILFVRISRNRYNDKYHLLILLGNIFVNPFLGLYFLRDGVDRTLDES